MKRNELLILIVLLGCLASAQAQKPQLSIHAGVGYWSSRLPDTETYSLTIEKWRSGTQSLAVSLDFAPQRKLSFAPMLDVNLYRRSHSIQAGTFWDLDADLHLLYVRASPGLRLHLSKSTSLRLGMSGQLLAVAWGSLVKTGRNSAGEDRTINYSGRLRDVLRPFSFGPDLQLLFRIPLGRAGALEPGLHSYFSFNRMQQYQPGLGYNPWIWQLGLQLGYVLPSNVGENGIRRQSIR